MISFSSTIKTMVLGLAILGVASCGNAKEHSKAGGSNNGAPARNFVEKNANSDTNASGAGDPYSVEVAGGSSKEVTSKILKAFQENLDIPPKLVNRIVETPMKGVYEVVVGKSEVVYASADARFVFMGQIIDLEKKENLTELTKTELSKIDISLLNAKDTITTKIGDGSREVFVFADPDCPFCKMLQRHLLSMDNITIHTYLMGLTSLHPRAHQHATTILCQKDPAKAWNDWTMSDERDFEKMFPESLNCETRLKKNQELSDSIGVNGTPVIVFKDGRKVSGALPVKSIEKYLEEADKKAGK